MRNSEQYPCWHCCSETDESEINGGVKGVGGGEGEGGGGGVVCGTWGGEGGAR